MELINLDNKSISEPFGLNNTGSICYLNSLLQVIASCTSINDVINKTHVSIVMQKYINDVKKNNVNAFISSSILTALKLDIPYFGIGQESASEAFILIINTINNPILTSLFTHRYKCRLTCDNCNYTNYTIDTSIVLNLFYMNEVNEKNILNHISELNDYKCEKCKHNKGKRQYILTMLPEIIFCTFNIYFEKKIHSFPNKLTFPGVDGDLHYTLIGQIEHSGSLNGGHYWSRALRRDNKVYLFNDSYFELSKFEPTENTYIIVYHKSID